MRANGRVPVMVALGASALSGGSGPVLSEPFSKTSPTPWASQPAVDNPRGVLRESASALILEAGSLGCLGQEES
jgi:hypothetical protein